jgi:hypothetical protein
MDPQSQALSASANEPRHCYFSKKGKNRKN